MRGFSINIQGRVKNFNLPKNQPLVPLFEAVVNSIHSIEERKSMDESFQCKIIIKIIRSGQLSLEGLEEAAPIRSFEIIDNGAGFNEANLISFMESDSAYKASYGGKGVGRFSWIIAFKKIEIESLFWDEDKKGYVKRSFDFNPEQTEINDILVDHKLIDDNKTTVRLLNCIKPYADNIPKKGITIAMHILQYCLVYFILEKD